MVPGPSPRDSQQHSVEVSLVASSYSFPIASWSPAPQTLHGIFGNTATYTGTAPSHAFTSTSVGCVSTTHVGAGSTMSSTHV